MSSHDPTRFSFVRHSAGERELLDVGGNVLLAEAAVALNIGDAVEMLANGQVTKTAVVTNHKNRLGIVVGGDSTERAALAQASLVGTLAAAANEQVLVLVSGIAYGVSDEAVVFGDKLKLGATTAGRLLPGLDTTELVAGITGSIVGQALEAAAAAGTTIKVLVALG